MRSCSSCIRLEACQCGTCHADMAVSSKGVPYVSGETSLLRYNIWCTLKGHLAWLVSIISRRTSRRMAGIGSATFMLFATSAGSGKDLLSGWNRYNSDNNASGGDGILSRGMICRLTNN